MDPSDAVLLTALLIVVVLVAAWYARRRGGDNNGHPDEAFCPGPHNIGLYDHPYKGYPTYEGRGATWWDGDNRCAASYQQSPCAIWCR